MFLDELNVVASPVSVLKSAVTIGVPLNGEVGSPPMGVLVAAPPDGGGWGLVAPPIRGVGTRLRHGGGFGVGVPPDGGLDTSPMGRLVPPPQ